MSVGIYHRFIACLLILAGIWPNPAEGNETDGEEAHQFVLIVGKSNFKICINIIQLEIIGNF